MRRRAFTFLSLLAVAAEELHLLEGNGPCDDAAACAARLGAEDSLGGLSLLQRRATALAGLDEGGASEDAAPRPSAPLRAAIDDWDSPSLWDLPPDSPEYTNWQAQADPDFATQDWAAQCLFQDPTTNTSSYKMKHWMGRLGNNIVQVLNVMSIASCSGLESFQMLLPPRKSTIQIYQLFPSLPQVLGLPSGWRPSSCKCEVCANQAVCNTFFAHCRTTVQDRRAFIREFLEPHIAKEADCGHIPADASAQDVLTMHIRSGDVSRALTLDHAQPPCVYYEEVVRRGIQVSDSVWRPYSRVLVITETLDHPCLPHIQEGLAGVPVEIQSGSLFQDWCSLVTAQHLALSHSEFSTMAIFFNRNLRSLHQITLGMDANTRKWGPCRRDLVESYMESNALQLCEAFEPNSRVTLYDFPRDGFSDAEKYFHDYPLSNAEIFGCDSAASFSYPS